ncbi:acetyl-CoA hydrolase/transferase C-terminal domain-containing protein, partial [Hyphomonas sp. ND6WE1B]
TPPLYTTAGKDARFNFQPVSVTHSVPVLAAIPRLAAINGGVEVDLFGQLNSEWVKGRQVASTGGLGNFVRGAQLSEGGRSIIALPATARGGSLSRIVVQLASPTVTLSRAEAGYVVTEYGVADLTTADIDQRAERLIAISAPDFRDELANQWAKLRASL